MNNKLTVLVAGSTGMLGTKIVSALLDKGNVDVRAMVRSSNDTNPKNRQKIDAMKAKGATIVEGDAIQPETLLPLCTGVDVVVSAIVGAAGLHRVLNPPLRFANCQNDAQR